VQQEQLELTTTSMEDLKSQRDQWQKQAQQVLITSQYSQKQAEEYKTELKTREEAARRRRKKREEMMAERAANKNHNLRENSQEAERKLTEENQSASLLDVQGLWKKIKGDKAA